MRWGVKWEMLTQDHTYDNLPNNYCRAQPAKTYLGSYYHRSLRHSTNPIRTITKPQDEGEAIVTYNEGLESILRVHSYISHIWCTHGVFRYPPSQV